MPEQVVQQIRIQHLHVADFHHRSDWSHLVELRDSISANGIIQPLVVRKRKAGGYEIGAGVCRMKAAVMAELKTAPCLVVELDDEDFIALQVEENRRRRGLHPLDEALYYEELHKRGHNNDQIAKRMAVKKRDVIAKMRLIALSPAGRKAFVEGKFDEDAAVALASTSDPGKQRDVLAALAAGTLQADEIVGYIRREFTAQLDDVPWRMTDEKLVVKAGPCTTCPKRSDVQKELFPSGQTGLRCLDVDCHRSKMDAIWQVEINRPEVQLLDQRPESLFVLSSSGTRPTSMRSSGMVDADAPCPHLTGKTWREAVFALVGVDGDAPSIYLAKDQDGRPRFLMREGVVGRMVKKSDAAKGEQADATDDETPGDSATPSPRAEGKIRRLTVQRFAERIAAGDFDTLDWIAERLIDGSTVRVIALVADLLEASIRALDLGGDAVPEGKHALSLLAQSSNRQAKRIVTSLLIFEEADGIGEIPPSLTALGMRCGLDISAIESEIRK